ncbi:DUF4440 domain-containing protein [Bacillaceae bacterium Marseille-Q3522]|nr:DUF4440 domain-containing protein [Bacillaceae bacterium Marseille-Q3522]
MSNDSKLKEHLKKLEESLLTSEVRLSHCELNNLLAEEFFEFGSSGNLWRRDDFFQEDGAGIVQMSLSQFEIHPLSDNVVLATYHLTDKKTQRHTLRSSVWKYIDGGWKMVFHQGTVTNLSQMKKQ